MKKVLRKISHFILTFVRITEVRFTNPYQFLVKDNEAYQDDIEGHTFFMESNRRSKEIASRYGIQLPVIQQTFIIPELHLLPFLQSLAGMLQAKQLTPSLFDIVPIAVDDILMSASRGLNGFAVSVAFEDLYRSTILELHRQLEAAIAVCNDLGGRVYMVINVYATSEQLHAMYTNAMERFLRMKEQLDPKSILYNSFLKRVFVYGQRLQCASSVVKMSREKTPLN